MMGRVVGGSPLIDSFTVFPEQSVCKKQGRLVRKKSGWQEAAWGGCCPPPEAFGPPPPTRGSLFNWQLSEWRVGWDALEDSKRRLIKYYSTPPMIPPTFFSLTCLLVCVMCILCIDCDLVLLIIWPPQSLSHTHWKMRMNLVSVFIFVLIYHVKNTQMIVGWYNVPYGRVRWRGRD